MPRLLIILFIAFIAVTLGCRPGSSSLGEYSEQANLLLEEHSALMVEANRTLLENPPGDG